ncbi:unnamed protein product [Chilo suppressalis]|uniref:Uncharacterized protein n=1 Tax=Chilo suppressalis TaxID=168631 RepID=A0ABN8L5H6_CHISP|nr:unnamed protein product [Chilo suppressalis]
MMEASSSRFTAAEGGARLAMAAHHKNILAVEYASFIATRLIHEDAYKIRGSLFAGKQRSVYVTRSSRVPCVTYELNIMTDLKVVGAAAVGDVYDWYAELDSKEVLVCTSSVLKHILDEETLTMDNINVLIVDSCHLVWNDQHLQCIMKLYKDCVIDRRPRILALTYPLFTPNKYELDDKMSNENFDNSQERTTKVEKQNKELDGNVTAEEEDFKQEEEKVVIEDTDKAINEKDDEILTEVPDVSMNDKDDSVISENNEKALVKFEKNKVGEVDINCANNEKALVKFVETNKFTEVDVNCDDYDMYEKLEWKIEMLEEQLCCDMDLAEDIDGGKRLSSTLAKPKELVIEYAEALPYNSLPEAYIELDSFMRNTVKDALDFIKEHRYDPTEIYGEDLYEEFKNIPDPTIEPKYIFSQFLYVLDQLGPYAADKAAFSLLSKLEKLKIKVPYERHFILLCLCTTVFVKMRCYADQIFSKYESDWDKIKLFSTPKVLRFAEILFKFQPPELQKSIEENTAKMLSDLEKCDFVSLGNKIEDRVNSIEANLKDLEDYSVGSNTNANVDKETNFDSARTELDKPGSELDKTGSNLDKPGSNLDKTGSDIDSVGSKTEVTSEVRVNEKSDFVDSSVVIAKNSDSSSKLDTTGSTREFGKYGFSRRSGGRVRGRGRSQRGNLARVQQMQQNPDALCGIVFMREALMAKIMFMLIVDMSRAHPKLSYLCAQYCAVETPADPGTEPKECQRQGKKQEEVLKKFRMHECNLLLATSALEEGIDLPRCNLVLRWDTPPSYRSYGLSRGRARASRASCVVLSRGDGTSTEELVHNLAIYRELDQIISRKCDCGIQDEPPESEESSADTVTMVVKPYTPQELDKTSKHNEHKHKEHIVENAMTKELDTKTNEVKNDNSLVDLLKQVTISETNGIDETNLSTINKEHIVERTDTILKDNLKTNEHSKKTSDLSKKTNEDTEKDVECSVIENELDYMKIDENNLDSDISKIINESIEDSSKCANMNMYCNRCNSLKVSDSVECACLMRSVSSSARRTDNKVERDGKKISDCEVASVDLSTAIALINRYCGKLPSDTFTRLAPQWWMEKVQLPTPGSDYTRTAYVCTLRLPLNCPVKYNIVGHPMPTRVLARRMVALQACRILHKSGELDNQLMPIGKENFKAAELETTLACNNSNTETTDPNDAARPGSTKRRQYYFKKTAWAFTDCQPVIDTKDSEIDPQSDVTQTEEGNTEPVKKGNKRNMLYAIVSKLWCALPERYNTRGRRLHAPQHASQAIGILMAREHNDDLQIPAFPVYTRSGEVRVSVEYVPDADVRMSPRRGRLVRRFMRFVFAEVLRVRRRGMKLSSEGCTQNNYYIVPTVRSTREDGTSIIDIDWAFLELIYQHTEEKKLSELEKPILWNQDEEEVEQPDKKVEKEKERDGKVKEMENPLLKDGEVFVFDAEKYKEAVVTPWYRNQDQPQFFLVAEICWHLTPDSAFPSAAHTSFRAYYLQKYGAKLTQPQQPLLDVDHTSARLNLLTPRYVNRKGVALPVSSERTRRAKRDRLDQKQILVPELCRVHPFAAPLWFATVALPCVLYRINALLIADEIRRAVAVEVGLGVPKIDEDSCPGFTWPPLDFGWSLAEVLSADTEKCDKKKDEEDIKKEEKIIENGEQEQSEIDDSPKEMEEPAKEKTINDILQEKEEAESGFEIGTWSNDMASSIPDAMEYNEFMEPLPPNLTFCTSASGGTNWSEPIEKPKSQYNPSRTFSMAESDCSYMSSDFDTDDSDLNSDSDEDTESSGFWSKGSLGVRIEYKTAHEAEAVDVERKKKVNPAPQPDERDDDIDKRTHYSCIREGNAPAQYIEKFRNSVSKHETEIVKQGNLVPQNEHITDILPETKDRRQHSHLAIDEKVLSNLFPYGDEELKTCDGQITLESIEKNKRVLLHRLKSSLPKEEVKKLNCFSMIDVDIDSPNYVNEKVANVGFDTKECYKDKISRWDSVKEFKSYYNEGRVQGKEFDFDYQPPLEGHPGPSPSVILQALTMSNANDGINLERLETIGDSFLKFAITAYLYCAHPTVHEGKLSHMRSKQVSNQNLYRLGRARRLGARMTASKFEPHDNWLPPCHRPPHTQHSKEQNSEQNTNVPEGTVDKSGCFIPYNLITQHSIPDKSIADCVEALIGAYLLECGPRGALLFMSWLGIRVLPRHVLPLPANHPYVVAEESRVQKKPEPQPSKPNNRDPTDSESSCSEEDEPWQQEEEDIPPEEQWGWPARPVGSLRPHRNNDGQWVQPIFGELKAPPSPLLRYIEDPEGELERMLSGYDALEKTLQYRFRDRSLLLQALTHASHQTNRLTDCYQRLEFLGDAVLDYLITRHLYEDSRRHSPGALTDLRSALVNNTIFATLAARHGFHKYFRHMSPGLNEVLTRYVKIQEENGHSISEEHYLIQEDEMEQAEDVEVPKALGDLFESVAGAIFLDSGMSLGAVWKSYVNLMGAELEAFSAAAPKSPIRELLEAEPDTAKFGKPERLADGRRVRVCVEVFGRGTFKGVGRNYRIAKGTAARCALRHLRIHRAR